MNIIKDIISASIDVKQQVLQNEELLSKIDAVINVVTNAFKNGNKVLFCGNGGSAAV
jgi:D-sedoheptulose 7-phosphate isomerase